MLKIQIKDKKIVVPNRMDSKNLFKLSTKSSLFLLTFFFFFSYQNCLTKTKKDAGIFSFLFLLFLKIKFQLNIPRRVFLRLLFLARSVRHSVNCYRSYKKKKFVASLIGNSKQKIIQIEKKERKKSPPHSLLPCPKYDLVNFLSLPPLPSPPFLFVVEFACLYLSIVQPRRNKHVFLPIHQMIY